MARPRSIARIVSQFKKMTDEDRYIALSAIMTGDATSAAELSWRALLCSALEKAEVYPQEKHENSCD